jgi:hypothetical protein
VREAIYISNVFIDAPTLPATGFQKYKTTC